MIIKTLAQAKRAIAVVGSLTLLVGGGAVFQVLEPEMPKPERLLIIGIGVMLLAAGLGLLVTAATGLTRARRLLKIGCGFALLVVGLILSIPGVPGPGLLTILAALVILAGEFVWARKLLDRVKHHAEQVKNAVANKRSGHEPRSEKVR